MAWIKLTPARVEILNSWLTALEANIETGEGDFYVGIENHKPEDIRAALQWLQDMIAKKQYILQNKK